MSERIDSVKSYALVWLGLLALTAVTTGAAYVDLGPLNIFATLAIAGVKMLLVALYFMHVRHSAALTKYVTLGGLLWLAILLALTMADFATRAWQGVVAG